jgi:hypothetical protein
MQRCRSTILAMALLVVAAACSDEDAFTTSPGECFRGGIIGADFVRTGFDAEVRALLTVDVRNLTNAIGEAGRLWTTDRLFEAAPVNQMRQVSNDTISLFQFPGGRIRNYLAHARAADGTPATIVISLMENDSVELRIIRPPSGDSSGPPALFGVFRLALDEQCTLPGEA